MIGHAASRDDLARWDIPVLALGLLQQGQEVITARLASTQGFAGGDAAIMGR
jgi:hypothetical protein